MLSFKTLVVLVFSLTNSLIEGSKFTEDLVVGPNGNCPNLESSNYNIDNLFPQLNKCFASTSLYNTPAAVICKPECKMVVIEASKHLLKTCKIEAPGPNSQRLRSEIYYQWSNLEDINTLCNKDTSFKGLSNDIKDPSNTANICVNRIMSSLTIIANAESSKGYLDSSDKKKACISCINDIYNKYYDRPESLPRQYGIFIANPKRFFAAYRHYCIND